MEVRETYFRPQESVQLPEQYAHFTRLDNFIKNLDTLRDSEFHDTVYENLWVGLCMSIDKKKQEEAVGDLKNNIQDAGIDEHGSLIGDYWKKLEADSVYPIYESVAKNYEGLHVDPGEIESRQEFQDVLYNRKNGVMHGPSVTVAIDQQLQKLNAPDEISSYVRDLQKLLTARTLATSRLFRAMHEYEKVNAGKLTISSDKSFNDQFADKFGRLLERSAPYHEYHKIQSRRVNAEEIGLFGDDTAVAEQLWKSAIFLRTKTLPKGISGGDIRATLMEKLLAKDYEGARYYLEEQVARYPGLIPDFAVDDLNIDPEELAKMQDENDQEKAQLHYDQEKKKQEEIIQAREHLRQFIGITLVSPDGKHNLKITGEHKNINAFYFSYQGFSETLPHVGGGTLNPRDLQALTELYDLKPLD